MLRNGLGQLSILVAAAKPAGPILPCLQPSLFRDRPLKAAQMTSWPVLCSACPAVHPEPQSLHKAAQPGTAPALFHATTALRCPQIPASAPTH